MNNTFQLPFYRVSAFAERFDQGNPAAVCILEQSMEDSRMQAIALENNLSETAFLIQQRGMNTGPVGGHYQLRWFTPFCEVDLCGHATLASAHVLFTTRMPEQDRLVFTTRSGPLSVCRNGFGLSMDLPAHSPVAVALPQCLARVLPLNPDEVYQTDDLLLVYGDSASVTEYSIGAQALPFTDCRGVIITAPGIDFGVDFVYRWFGARVPIIEDPVTGSAQCSLMPYWAKRLGKKRLHSLQCSRRGGKLVAELHETCVCVTGKAVTYFEGVIELPQAWLLA